MERQKSLGGTKRQQELASSKQPRKFVWRRSVNAAHTQLQARQNASVNTVEAFINHAEKLTSQHCSRPKAGYRIACRIIIRACRTGLAGPLNHDMACRVTVWHIRLRACKIIFRTHRVIIRACEGFDMNTQNEVRKEGNETRGNVRASERERKEEKEREGSWRGGEGN
eukprot:1162051-Pelagomonas_calceolata.AAC.11